ncbi:MAG: glycine--tRNA ligase subunit beta [Novosphingobium sp.]|jgi:glycyl-tRNA synthetase beta chain|uniref:glycine--tRNA ligase subunit beta n=1 Tax=Novosphingobium sp. TaxID=1874826 RepID=UPI00391DAF0D|nr:glycine--tRNA ligase subunit beta [Novosphingobium sp.]
MSDFLLELRCEEIPARMQAGARADLEKLFRKEMDAAGVAVGEVTVWSTPRRLALIARGLPAATAAISEEVKGPRVGAPPQALEGFLRKAGLTEDQLVERDGVLFAITEKPGRATAEVLAEAIPAIVRAFPWPKSQRWGAASISTESPRWVRPLSAIVALFDGQVVDCEVGGIKAGRLTKGHRFHSSGEISVDGVDDYAAKLRAAHVIVDHVERQDLIRSKASEAAAAVGLKLVEDEGLVIENAGLTEWPVPLLGRFDEQFLEVPPEVIQLTARTNQKYFVCEDAAGKLANAFVCTANIAAADGGAAIVAGNRKVLAARLSDARFFWEQDRKTALSDHAKKLERITFHEKLGTVADKVERVAKLARWLEENRSLPGCEEAELAEQAARLCKADLVTEMVGEFPELQGLMGGYYARAEGLPDAVADAIRDHYKPVGQGDEVPTDPVTVAVALADKLDSLFSFFAYQLVPTGSKDPFALRRAAIGALSIIQSNQIRLKYFEAFEVISPLLPVPTGSARGLALIEYPPFGKVDVQAVALLNFIIDRLKVQQREAGVRHDLIDAVFALGGEDDLVRLLARVHALQAFVGTEDGANLLAGYKRAANILKKEDFTGGEEIALSYTPEPAERALVDALAEAGPRAAAAVAGEDFARAMAALASLRAPIDAFFEQVTVNDADPAKRTFRLNLLARLRDAVHGVADFSKIEG